MVRGLLRRVRGRWGKNKTTTTFSDTLFLIKGRMHLNLKSLQHNQRNPEIRKSTFKPFREDTEGVNLQKKRAGHI